MKAILIAALACAALLAEQFPNIKGENLLGKSVELPAVVSGHTAILVVGFTHGSQSQTKAWSQRLAKEFPDASKAVVYSIAVLEDAPRLVRGMAVHGIKSGVPEADRGRFLVVYHGEADLKKIAEFERPEEAYVMVLAPDGAVGWRLHGAVTDAAVTELRSHL